MGGKRGVVWVMLGTAAITLDGTRKKGIKKKNITAGSSRGQPQRGGWAATTAQCEAYQTHSRLTETLQSSSLSSSYTRPFFWFWNGSLCFCYVFIALPPPYFGSFFNSPVSPLPSDNLFLSYRQSSQFLKKLWIGLKI